MHAVPLRQPMAAWRAGMDKIEAAQRAVDMPLRFSLIGFALKILKSVSPSATRAIEQFQDDRNKALRLFSG
jgi:hypothetical protein